MFTLLWAIVQWQLLSVWVRLLFIASVAAARVLLHSISAVPHNPTDFRWEVVQPIKQRVQLFGPCCIKRVATDKLPSAILSPTMALSKEYQPNDVRKTRKVPRSVAGFRKTTGFIAAIDFGTTYCSVAYTLKNEKDFIKLTLDGHHTRVPNAILIERGSHKVDSFGYRAQERFTCLKKQQEKFMYFERMKMILYRTPVSQS